jgi:hypothetical protein
MPPALSPVGDETARFGRAGRLVLWGEALAGNHVGALRRTPDAGSRAYPISQGTAAGRRYATNLLKTSTFDSPGARDWTGPRRDPESGRLGAPVSRLL